MGQGIQPGKYFGCILRLYYTRLHCNWKRQNHWLKEDGGKMGEGQAEGEWCTWIQTWFRSSKAVEKLMGKSYAQIICRTGERVIKFWATVCLFCQLQNTFSALCIPLPVRNLKELAFCLPKNLLDLCPCKINSMFYLFLFCWVCIR